MTVSELLFDIWFDYSPESDGICKYGSGGLIQLLLAKFSRNHNPSFEAKVACFVSPITVIIISAEGTFALLAGESVTCTFVSLGSTPDEVTWSRDGVELVQIMNKLKILNFPGSSVVTFETADAIVPGNYTCFVRFGSVESRVTQEIVLAGI